MNYFDVIFWLIGYFLGGYLVMIVVLEMRLLVCVFNFFSFINNMFEVVVFYVILYLEKYCSYCINKDYIGNFGINSLDDKLGIFKRVNVKK